MIIINSAKMIRLIFQIVMVASLSNLIFGATVKLNEANGITKRTEGKMVEDADAVICPIKNPRYPILIPHPEDCTKFYICESGYPHPKICQKGLHFNAKLKSCDYPEKAGCDKDITKKPKGKMIEDIDEGICPSKNPRYPILIPHPEDCTKFYICDSGSPHLKICQKGLHFNVKLKSCDYPENAGCQTDIAVKPKVRKPEDDDLGMCPTGNSKFPVYLPHESECNKFYICDTGVPHLKVCQSGLHFNLKLKACDYPENAGCDKDIAVKPKDKNLEDDDLGMCPAENSRFPVYLPHESECNKFYICDTGVPHLKVCQSGLHFNPKLKACDYPKNAGCNTDVENKPKGKKTGVEDFDSCPVKEGRPLLLPHPTDCSLFFVCFHGKKQSQRCPSGLHFNAIKQVCDFPENAECGKNQSPLLPQSTMQQGPGVRSPYCPSIDGKIPIFFRSSYNCSVYYMCSHGLAYEFACPARLHFNLRKRICDYEKNANCQIS